MNADPTDPSRRLVLLHGFTQTHHHWHRPAHHIARRIGRRTGMPPTLVLVDLPGHGLSAADRTPITTSGPSLARLGGPGTWIGYSMGGRFALHAALAPASPIDRLVLIGTTGGLTDPTERSARRRLDDDRATHLERIGVQSFVDEWLDAPLFATLPPDRADRAHRRRNTTAGLAASLRTAGTGTQLPLWEAIAGLATPTLVLAGELDEKFTAIGRQIAETMPDATFRTVPGAGHAAHAEAPDAVAEIVDGWLAG